MNFDRVIATVLRGDYDRLPTVQAGFGDYDNLDIEPREFDIDKAGAYFDAAGFDTRGGDGIRVKEDQRLTFKVTYGNPLHTERLVVLQEEAKKAGVELKLDLLDGRVLQEDAREEASDRLDGLGRWRIGAAVLELLSFVGGQCAAAQQLRELRQSRNGHPDRRLPGIGDQGRAVELARAIEQVVYDAGIVIPTFRVPYTRAGLALDQAARGLATRTSGSLFSPFSSSRRLLGRRIVLDRYRGEARDPGRQGAGPWFEPATIVNTDYRRPFRRLTHMALLESDELSSPSTPRAAQ